MKNTIIFILIHAGKEYPIETTNDQYDTLMILIADHLPILNFGICCGVGSCGTCMVEIREKHSSVKQLVLSCDVQINDALANTRIAIPENNY